MKNQLTYIDVINETVEYYSGKENKFGRTIQGVCRYFIDGNTCAVGRCLSLSEERLMKLDQNSQTQVKKLFSRNLLSMNCFKSEYVHLSNLEFWEDLQKLHDNGANWDIDSDGNVELSSTGQNTVNKLKEDYK